MSHSGTPSRRREPRMQNIPIRTEEGRRLRGLFRQDVDDQIDYLGTELRAIPRPTLERILASISIQCYDHESREVLIEAIKVNLQDGTLTRQAIVDILVEQKA